MAFYLVRLSILQIANFGRGQMLLFQAVPWGSSKQPLSTLVIGCGWAELGKGDLPTLSSFPSWLWSDSHFVCRVGRAPKDCIPLVTVSPSTHWLCYLGFIDFTQNSEFHNILTKLRWYLKYLFCFLDLG